MTHTVLLWTIAWLGAAADTKGDMPNVIDAGTEPQLFLDDRCIEFRSGLKREWHRPQKLPNPVIAKLHSWEGLGPYAYGSVLRDHKSGQFKIWYNCYVGGRPDYFACYATSRDGIQWDRPACDAVTDPRLPLGNNVVMLGSGLPNYRQCLSPTVLFRPDEPDLARRYAMLYWDVSAGDPSAGSAVEGPKFFGLCLAHSPDGIRWTNHSANPVFDGASDVTDGQYDPATQRYLLHYKIWRVEGDVVASKLPRGQAGNVTYWPTWDPVKLEGGGVRFQGRVIDYRSAHTTPMTGSVDFAREPKYRRVVARAESKDLIHWNNARLIFELPEPGDPADLSTYGLSSFTYAGRYLGLLRVFHADREIDLELAFSNDDRVWKRATPREPFIPLGSKESFDAGMVFSTNAPVVVEDELWFYYGAFTRDHATSDGQQSASIGLAKLRLDGFVSLTASREVGELITVPLRLKNPQLLINAAASDGEIAVEVRDQQGRPLPGFTFADNEPFRVNSVSHTLKWKGKDFAMAVSEPVRLAFRLKNARLFSFRTR